MTNHVWVVTFHFNRGHAQVVEFDNKQKASEAVRIAVFNNEDCINCSIYRKDGQKVQTKLEKMNAYLDIVDKM